MRLSDCVTFTRIRLFGNRPHGRSAGRFVFAVLTLLLGSSCSAASPEAGMLASRRMPADITGVSIHAIGDRSREFSAMREAGIRYVRLDLNWQRTEPQAGRYDWSYYDALLADATRLGLQPILILAYSNSAYERSAGPGYRTATLPPRSPEGSEAFSRWVGAAVARYQRYRPAWEIWNEPNKVGFWPPRALPSEYQRLAERACSVIRSIDRSAVIVAPGLGMSPPSLNLYTPWLQSALSPKLGRCLSAVSIHPYPSLSMVDRLPEMWRGLRSHLAGDGYGHLGIASSESGVSTFSGKVSAEAQALFLVKTLILDSVSSLRFSIWYDWRDDGQDPDNPQHHFGLTDASGDPKAAYWALKRLILETQAYDRICLMDDRRLGLAWFWRSNDTGRAQLVAWSKHLTNPSAAGAGPSFALPNTLRIRDIRNLLGEPVRPVASRGQLVVNQSLIYATVDRPPISGCLAADSAGHPA